jgi:hypothetical protein
LWRRENASKWQANERDVYLGSDNRGVGTVLCVYGDFVGDNGYSNRVMNLPTTIVGSILFILGCMLIGLGILQDNLQSSLAKLGESLKPVAGEPVSKPAESAAMDGIVSPITTSTVKPSVTYEQLVKYAADRGYSVQMDGERIRLTEGSTRIWVRTPSEGFEWIASKV